MNRSRLLRWLMVAALTLGCVTLTLLWVIRTILIGEVGPGRSRPLTFTISRETTYITGPLRADGTVDYLADLNRRSSEGVRPENNASVLIWQALGPGPLEAELRDEFFQALGVPTPPENGEYFVTWDNFVQPEHERVEDKVPPDPALEEQIEDLLADFEDPLDVAMSRAWTAQEFPQLAEWLAKNEKPLRLAVQASRRPRRYDPLVVAPDEPYRVMTADISGAAQSRLLGNALVTRAMLRVSEERTDEAWQDLLAAHRLSRLVMQGPTLVEWLCGMEIDRNACAGERALICFAPLPTKQITHMRNDLGQLPPAASVIDRLDIGERFYCLDSVVGITRDAAGTISPATSDNIFSVDLVRAARESRFDWDLVCAKLNAQRDKQIAACRQPTRAERQAALGALEAAIAKDLEESKSLKTWIVIAFGSQGALSESVADVFINLLFPASFAICDSDERVQMELNLTKTAFALAAYRADRGSYPAALAELVPQYLPAVPEDVFLAKPLRYEAADGGYLLHSAGRDGVFKELPEAGQPLDKGWTDDLIVDMRSVPAGEDVP